MNIMEAYKTKTGGAKLLHRPSPNRAWVSMQTPAIRLCRAQVMGETADPGFLGGNLITYCDAHRTAVAPAGGHVHLRACRVWLANGYDVYDPSNTHTMWRIRAPKPRPWRPELCREQFSSDGHWPPKRSTNIIRSKIYSDPFISRPPVSRRT